MQNSQPVNCPWCLQGDAEPYFRRQWRLTFVTLCPQHRCQLLDRCAACAAPCSPSPAASPRPCESRQARGFSATGTALPCPTCGGQPATACAEKRQTISRMRNEKDKTRVISGRDRNTVNGKSRFTAPPSSRPAGMAARFGLKWILSLGLAKTRAIAQSCI